MKPLDPEAHPPTEPIAAVAAEALTYGTDTSETAYLFQAKDSLPSNDATLLPTVIFDGRKSPPDYLDRCIRVIFILGTLLHLSVCTYFITARNVCLWQPEGICANTPLRREFDECSSRYGLPPLVRSLQSSPKLASLNAFQVFYDHPWIPACVLAGIPLLVLAWFKLLQYAARAVTWISMIFGCVVYIVMGVKIDAGGGTSLGMAFILYGAAILCISVVSLQNKVDRAAESLQVGVGLLLRNPYILLASAVLEVIMLAMLAGSMFGIGASYQIWVVEDTGSGCELHLMPRVISWLRSFCVLFLGWLMLFFESAKLVTSAMCIGREIFSQSQLYLEEDAATYPFRALRISLSSSVGTIAVGSLVVAVAERMVEHGRRRWWFTSVTGCVYHYTLSYCEQFIKATNRFALIAHAFSGDGFIGASRRAYHVMSRNFVSSMVADQVGVYVLSSAAKGVSLCVVLLTWFLIDETQGWGSLSNIMATFNYSFFAVALFAVLLLIFLEYPLLGVILISWFQASVTAKVCSTAEACELQAPIAGLFMGCIARLVFNFQASVLLHALDSVFIAYAISKENKVKLVEERLYVMVESSEQLL